MDVRASCPTQTDIDISTQNGSSLRSDVVDSANALGLPFSYANLLQPRCFRVELHNDDGSWQMACLLQRFVQVGWVGASLRQTLGSDCELSIIIAVSGTWDVVHSCLWQAEVGTMSLCHGVMPITVDDTFALVSASLSRYR